MYLIILCVIFSAFYAVIHINIKIMISTVLPTPALLALRYFEVTQATILFFYFEKAEMYESFK